MATPHSCRLGAVSRGNFANFLRNRRHTHCTSVLGEWFARGRLGSMLGRGAETHRETGAWVSTYVRVSRNRGKTTYMRVLSNKIIYGL